MNLIQGDCLAELKRLKPESVHALVTDPPAGISFMGKEWDSDKGGRKQWISWMTSVMEECLRVMKPGAHGLIWAIPRTSHWTATALEDAGFEVRDVVTHLFGSGFPKSLDVSKAIDKAGGQAGIAISGEAKRWQGFGTERNAGREGMPKKQGGGMTGSANKSLKTGSGNERDCTAQNHHPTVKPKKLMAYLIRMVTPPGGTVLDPFMGSGSTGIAAIEGGFRFVGIEREAEYTQIAEKRIYHAMPEFRKQMV